MSTSVSIARVVIAAGGTGGHVFPGLAAAHLFQAQGSEVHWLGAADSFEWEQVSAAGFSFHAIPARGLRGKSGWRKLWALMDALLAVGVALRELHRLKPKVVLGFGGFVAGPVGLASALLRIPLVIHEQNAVAGMTNRCLGLWAKKILVAFPKAFAERYSNKIQWVGNPLRVEMTRLLPPATRFAHRSGPLRVLVLGGSLGAQALNECVPQGLALLKNPVEVIHQAGKHHLQAAENAYRACHLSVDVRPFIADMASVYAWADLVICRAGALTVSELAAVGVASVLVPFPFAVDDHQTQNAAFLVQAGAAVCMAQKAFTPEKLCALLEGELSQRTSLLAMAQAAHGLAKLQATQSVVEACLAFF